MLIGITDNHYLSLLNINKTDTYRLLSNEGNEIYDIVDDLLAIDWLKMSSYIFYGSGEFIDFEFMSHEEFVEWLQEHHCLYKDDIEDVTYELLQKQFPTFTLENWDRFYNAILFLNLNEYYNELTGNEQLELFSRLFPKPSFFSPYAKKEASPVIALTKYAFSSTIEMLVYDIVEDIYYNEDAIEFGESEDEFHENFVFQLCNNMLSVFEYQKSGEEVLGEYTVERFIKDVFHAPWFDEITGKTYEHINLLFNLLNSSHIRELLSDEFAISKSNTELYGFRKLQITDFINADLIHRFDCKNYIDECYKKYEISGIDLFNFTEHDNIVLLLALYAKAHGKVSFAKCDICGHYFVRNQKNKKQNNCNRCKIQTAKWEGINSLNLELAKIRQRCDKAKFDIKKRTDEYKVILEELFQPLFKAYINGLEQVILQVSKEHIRYIYEQYDDAIFTELYSIEFKELKDQVAVDKQLLNCTTTVHEVIKDFSFADFQTEHLTPNKFIDEYEELADVDLIDGKGKLFETFSAIISILSAYNVSYNEIVGEYKRIINYVYPQRDVKPYIKTLYAKNFAGDFIPKEYR